MKLAFHKKNPCCCSCSFEPEVIKIGQSSHKMYSNNIVNFQESTTILNVKHKKKKKKVAKDRIATQPTRTNGYTQTY